VEASHVPTEIHRRIGGKWSRDEGREALDPPLLSNELPSALGHLLLSTLDTGFHYQKIMVKIWIMQGRIKGRETGLIG
jgi:hypothetical protein